MPNTHDARAGRDGLPEAQLAEQFSSIESRLFGLETRLFPNVAGVAARDEQWPNPRLGLAVVVAGDLHVYTLAGWQVLSGGGGSGGGVPESRLINAGAGLGGGGSLASDVTLDVGAGTGITVGANTVAVASNGITNTLAADMPGNTIKGNNTAATADPVDLTGTQATAMLDTFTSTAKGLVPASGGGSTKFLNADGGFTVPTPAAPLGNEWFSMTLVANWTIPSDSSNTVPFDSLDAGSSANAVTGAAAGFTAPRDGVMFFTAQLGMQMTVGSAVAVVAMALFFEDTTEVARGNRIADTLTAPAFRTGTLTVTMPVTAGKRYTVRESFNAPGATKIVLGAARPSRLSFFMGHYLA